MNSDINKQSEATLIAMLSRLLDMHDSRREKGTETSSKSIIRGAANEASGFHLNLGLDVINTLWTISADEGNKPISENRLFNAISEHNQEITIEDIRFVLKFLSASREIAFGDKGQRRTLRESTRLIHYDKRVNFASLTSVGRKYTRLRSQVEDWLLEDKAAKTIVMAIERSLFDKIPQLCNDAVSIYNDFNRQITEIEESPSRDIMAHKFIAQESHYRQMMIEAQNAVERAVGLIITSDIRDKFEQWKTTNHNDLLEYHHLSHLIKNVQVSIESLSRHFTELVSIVESGSRNVIGEVRFDQIAWRLVYDPIESSVLTAAIESAMPATPYEHEFHPTDFIGATEIYVEKEEQKEISYIIEDDQDPKDRIADFLSRNFKWLRKRLQQGNLSFSELLSSAPELMNDGDDIENIMGVYSINSSNDVDLGVNESILIGFTGGSFSLEVEGTFVTGDNIELCLYSPSNQSTTSIDTLKNGETN